MEASSTTRGKERRQTLYNSIHRSQLLPMFAMSVEAPTALQYYCARDYSSLSLRLLTERAATISSSFDFFDRLFPPAISIEEPNQHGLFDVIVSDLRRRRYQKQSSRARIVISDGMRNVICHYVRKNVTKTLER